MLMLGRSDAILNPAGVRFGSAEIYNVLLAKFSDEVADSVCVGQQRKVEADEKVLLFIKMEPGRPFSADLIGRVKKAIRDDLSPRHVPVVITECPDIPVTLHFIHSLTNSILSMGKRLRWRLKISSAGGQ
jgi:acetoacetyl-CoA synthetase